MQYANVSVERSSNGRRHNDTATFHLVRNSIGNHMREQKKEEENDEEKEDSNHWKHANDYNHVFYAFLCVDFNGINLWTTMPLQTPMTNRYEKKHIHLSLSLFRITHRLGRLFFFIILLISLIYKRWIMWWTWTRPFIAGQTENPLQFFWLHFIISSKRQLKSLLGLWFWIFGPKSLHNDIWGRLKLWPHSDWFLLQFNE